MERSVYEAEHENESTHWWFVERRRMFARVLRAVLSDPKAQILDVGTSTGTNLRMLKSLGFTNVVGVEISPVAADFARAKTNMDVVVADCTRLPFDDNRFDCILATDVLEHIDDDHQAVSEISRVLRAGGHLLVTVPAFMSLWGLQDDLSHHKRRYRRNEVRQLLVDNGLKIDRAWYFNFVLFPFILLVRRILRRIGTGVRSEGDINSPILNWLLGLLFRFDCWIAPVLRMPFGVSVCIVASSTES